MGQCHNARQLSIFSELRKMLVLDTDAKKKLYPHLRTGLVKFSYISISQDFLEFGARRLMGLIQLD